MYLCGGCAVLAGRRLRRDHRVWVNVLVLPSVTYLIGTHHRSSARHRGTQSREQREGSRVKEARREDTYPTESTGRRRVRTGRA
jgi:hypothetical protein